MLSFVERMEQLRLIIPCGIGCPAQSTLRQCWWPENTHYLCTLPFMQRTLLAAFPSECTLLWYPRGNRDKRE